jgi:hypothetical protein
MHALLPHFTDLIAAGFHALGSVPSPEVNTHYFLDPTRCLLASVAEASGRSRVREYLCHPLEVLAVATLCLESATGNRAKSVRLAHEQLTQWGVQFDPASTLSPKE